MDDSARDRFIDLYDLAPVGLLTVDEDGRVLECNLTLARMLGVEKGALRGARLVEFVHPDDRGRWNAHHERVLSRDTASADELRFRRADGKPFWARVECRLGHETDGRVVHRSAITDVSELAAAREELTRLRAALDQARDGIAFADMAGNIVFVNRTWARDHGWRAEELAGRPLAVFHTPRQLKEEVLPFNKKVLELGSWSGEVGHARRDGTEFRRWMTTVLLHDAEDRVTGFLGMTMDPSARPPAAKEAPAQRGA